MRDQLLASVGGLENFQRGFNWRTHSPERRAAQAVADALDGLESGKAELAAVGASDEVAAAWVAAYIAKWAKYQHAGARTANWMITGPARFPVERNRKRMEIEMKRYDEFALHAKGAARWAQRSLALAARREASDADRGGHEVLVVGDVKMVKNVALDRVQIIFPGKPEPDIIALLKRHAFRWAPSLGVWQRQLTANGLRAAGWVMDGVK